ncbi:hypothetical protein [Caviibacter abscessus]|uniref:hypothetical protein n=1 Tax=Caviibacter abscessus TaxID=1766719 RepID=UPI00082E6427|nr:hypothetical protein [Caviibacter abscessus]
MKKYYLILMAISSILSYSVNCELINNLANAKANKEKISIKLDNLTKKKVKDIDYIFSEVLKTSHQLVPKYVSSIVIFGINDNEVKKANEAIRIAVMANDLYKDLRVYVDGNKKIIELVKSLGIKETNIFSYNNNSEAIKDIIKHKNGRMDLLSRRVILVTKASNIRVGYASFINTLGENKDKIILDNYSYLDMSREQLEHPSKDEIIKAYKQIECK